MREVARLAGAAGLAPHVTRCHALRRPAARVPDEISTTPSNRFTTEVYVLAAGGYRKFDTTDEWHLEVLRTLVAKPAPDHCTRSS